MANYPPKPYYTNSEAIRMVLQPQNVPKVTRSWSTNNGFRLPPKPSFEPLLKPSYIRAETSRNNSLPVLRPPARLSRLEKAQNIRPFSAPKPKMRPYLKAPYAQRTFSAPLISRLQTRNSGIPRYSSLEDPHMHEYFARKFASRSRSSSLGSIRGTPTAYQVCVKVGEQRTAGTTACVYVRMIGRKARVPKQKLTSKNGLVQTDEGPRFKFFRGEKHVFMVKGPSISQMESIIVETDGLAKEESLYIENIEIEDIRSKKSWYFPCNLWWSLYESDCQISRQLFPHQKPKKYIVTDYEIVTKTGNKMGAGTDANVFITFYGSEGTTARLNLYTSIGGKKLFEKGQTDRIILHTKNVGKFKKIRIEHDNTGRAPGWFLDSVTIRDTKSNKSTYFSCNQWLAKNEGDGRICRDLLPSGNGHAGNTVNYKISVLTGTKRGAGTDANVFLTLFGDAGDSGEFQLRGKGNCFEKGNKDEFQSELPFLGPLNKLRIRHDNSGLAAGWFLDKIVVHDGRKTYEFPCDRWLSKTEDDGKISLDLTPLGTSSDVIPYQVTIKTGDKRFAGTNANIYLELHGSKHAPDADATSGRLTLEGGNFKRDSIDQIKLEVAGQFSPMSHIIIGHDNSGMGAGWFLDEVVIFCPTSGIEQHFPCGRWLATNEDDGLIERRLEEAKDKRHTQGKGISWDLLTYTSDLANAGTDANVHVTIYGQKGKSDKIELQSQSDTFERGESNKFSIETPDIGIPTKMRIGHDNKSTGAGWHLEKVELISRLTKDKYIFDCNRWLAVDEEDGLTFVELPATGNRVKKPLTIIDYEIDVFTGDKRGAGTNSDVTCTVFGKFGDTGERDLDKSETNKDKFERNKMDKFTIQAVDLGDLEKIRVGHNNKGIGAAWFLDKVIIRNIKDPEKFWIFPCGRWLAENEDDGQIVRELMLADSKTAIQETTQQNLLQTTTYKLSIRTGDVRGAGTNANVFGQIYGSKGDTGELDLRTSDNNKDPFERAKTDIFTIECQDIGKIERLRIGHDGSGVGSGWFLDEIEVSIPSRGENYRFPCNRWLDTGEADGQLEVTLTPVEKEVGEKEIPYEITIKTGDEKGAGTNSVVSLQIYGTDGKTRDRELGNKTDNFEQGQTDAFKISDLDVGKIQKIRLGIDGSGFGAAWLVEWLKIRKPKASTTRNKKSFIKERRPSTANKKRRTSSAHSRRMSKASINSQQDRPGSRRKSIALAPRKKSHRDRDSDEESEADTVSEEEEEFSEESEGSHRQRRQSQISGEYSEDEYEEESGSDEVFTKRRRSSARKDSYYSDSDDSDTTTTKSKKRNLARQSRLSTGRGNSSSDSEADHYDVYWFVCRKWFGKGKEDGQLVRELIPTDKQGNPIKRRGSLAAVNYELHVFTGDQSGAGTDANIFVTLYGDKGDTGERALKESKTNRNKFERNQEDVFELEAVDLGKIEKLKIWHDNKGLGAAWYLDKVEVISSLSNDKLIFPCEQWLSTSKDDGQICRDLVPLSEKQLRRKSTSASLKEEFGLEMSSKMMTYNVTVITAKDRGSGTNSNVFISLYGAKGDTGKIFLKSSKTHRDKFEADQTDEFSFEAADIGDVEKILIGHDNTGAFSDWKLASVTVDCPAMGRSWHFACDRWFATDKDDGALERELFASELASKQYESCIPYEITVYTSDVKGAATDADVYVALFGAEGQTTREMSLCPNKNDRKGKFNKGSIDKFIVQLEDVGNELSKMRIGHDGKGMGAGWHLDKVHVRKLTDKGHMSHVFLCSQWLASDEGDGSIVRDLLPQETFTETQQKDGSIKRKDVRRKSSLKLKEYKVSVFTADVFRAGTDANVFLCIFGEFGDTGKRQLKESKTHRNKFERANEDVFYLEAADLGPLQKIEIGHDSSSLLSSDDWMLDRVEVVDPEKDHVYVFHCERWIGKGKDDGATERTIFEKVTKTAFHSNASCFSFPNFVPPSQDTEKPETSKKSVTGTGRLLDFEQDENDAVMPYTIKVSTGTEKEAATSAPVWINIFGGKKTLETGRIQLEILGKEPIFKPGTTELFSVDARDVGKVHEIEIGIDSTAPNDAWFLSEIELIQPTKGRTYVFGANEWIGRGKADGMTSRRYYADDELATAQAFRPQLNYELQLITADEAGAGTDCNVWIQLFGENGNSDVVEIEKVESRFERSNNDLIKLELPDLGQPFKLRVGLKAPNSKASRQRWLFTSAQLHNLFSDKDYLFNAGQWLALEKSEGPPYLDLPALTAKGQEVLPRTEYVITTVTSDIMGAGTDANVSCVLFGQFGDSGQLDLINSESGGKFSKGSTDTFRFPNMMTLGRVTRVRIWHDNKGLGAAWHLDGMLVQDMATGAKFGFPCRQWLSTNEDDKQLCRELTCASGQQNVAEEGKTVYEITVTTGDKREAGTVHHGWLVLHGETKDSTEFWLHNSTRTKVLRRFMFPCKSWIQLAEKASEAIEFQCVSEHQDTLKTEQERKLVHYEVTVVTGDERGAGTDANVFATIFGVEGDSGRRALKQKMRNLFERGQLDSFVIEAKDLGTLTKLVIEHDDSGFGAGWLLDRVEIRNPETGQITRFPCKQWLDKSKGDKKIVRELLPEKN